MTSLQAINVAFLYLKDVNICQITVCCLGLQFNKNKKTELHMVVALLEIQDVGVAHILR